MIKHLADIRKDPSLLPALFPHLLFIPLLPPSIFNLRGDPRQRAVEKAFAGNPAGQMCEAAAGRPGRRRYVYVVVLERTKQAPHVCSAAFVQMFPPTLFLLLTLTDQNDQTASVLGGSEVGDHLSVGRGRIRAIYPRAPPLGLSLLPDPAALPPESEAPA